MASVDIGKNGWRTAVMVVAPVVLGCLAEGEELEPPSPIRERFIGVSYGDFTAHRIEALPASPLRTPLGRSTF
jgi:hypothetical protein